MQCDRANLLRDRGRHAEAQAAWIEAHDLLEALTRQQPQDQELRARLADAHLQGGRIQFDLGRYDEALQSFRRGQGIHQALADANPAVSRYRHGQIEAQMQIGWALLVSAAPPRLWRLSDWPSTWPRRCSPSSRAPPTSATSWRRPSPSGPTSC